jgi:hypothetical protein
MSLLIWIGVVWGGATLAMMLLLWNKPFYWNFKGNRTQLHTPLFKVGICAFFAAFLLLSAVPHVLLRFVGLRGFWDAKDKSYTLMNPFRRRGR